MYKELRQSVMDAICVLFELVAKVLYVTQKNSISGQSV